MKIRTFDEWFTDFVHYSENGNVQKNYVTPEGNRLGNWVQGIRQGKYRVTEEQRERLTEAGFVWKVQSRRTFDEWFADFVCYNENGNVQQTYVTPEGNRLGNWVQGIRQGVIRVTEEQRKRLTEAGFIWRIKSTFIQRTFDEWFADFVHYNENGNVQQTYVTPEGNRLGNWVQSIRQGEYMLTERQRERLTEAGFVWKVQSRRIFDEWFADFVHYNENGNVQQTYVTPEGNRLGLWVSRVRSGCYKLTEAQKKRLTEAGFVWRIKSIHRAFDEWLVDFVRYNENGNVKITYITPEGHRLGEWVHNVRVGTIKLTDEQRKCMNDAGFVWQIRRGRKKESK